MVVNSSMVSNLLLHLASMMVENKQLNAPIDISNSGMGLIKAICIDSRRPLTFMGDIQ